ncbi:MAG: aminotransferase class I/II-fold pyridoxal phosphate-dependent enzyme, partial [Planctomycetes bacterium]|nr:aminotransferase class I/II-fold pyridoxal phosphate-dependent enzyme [Planctomycetota bacterium]
PERRRQLRQLAACLRSRLAAEGFATRGEDGPIVPLIVGEPERVMAWATRLEERGFLVGAIRPPSVPRQTSRLRISLSCAHTPADVDAMVQTLRETQPGGFPCFSAAAADCG